MRVMKWERTSPQIAWTRDVWIDTQDALGEVHFFIRSLKRSEDGLREYAECLVFVDKRYYGIQEMQTKHFESGRYQKLTGWKTAWVRWRMKSWRKNAVVNTREGYQS